MVDNSRDAIVGCNVQKMGLELLALADIDGENRIGQPGLFQKQGNLVSVVRGPVIHIDHGYPWFMRLQSWLAALSRYRLATPRAWWPRHSRSEEHTSELQSLMLISYALYCL